VLARCLAQVGAFAEGAAVGAEAVRIAEVVKHPFGLTVAYYGVGFVALCQGHLPQAIAGLERSLAVCRAESIGDWFPHIASSLGIAYLLSGRRVEALPLLEESVAHRAATRGGRPAASLVANLSEGYGLADRRVEATQLGQQALEAAQAGKQQGHQAYALRLLGEIAAHCDLPESALAESHYQQALALANALGMRPLQAHCHRGLGMLYSQTGQVERARAELTTAIALYRAMEMTFWLPQTEAALAQVERW
jgi:tetratricopeptide (TPR) repeat protein